MAVSQHLLSSDLSCLYLCSADDEVLMPASVERFRLETSDFVKAERCGLDKVKKHTLINHITPTISHQNWFLVHVQVTMSDD